MRRNLENRRLSCLLLCVTEDSSMWLPQSMLRDLHRQGQNMARTRVLEFRDDRGWTPLLVASAKGYHGVVELVSNGRSMHAKHAKI